MKETRKKSMRREERLMQQINKLDKKEQKNCEMRKRFKKMNLNSI